MLSLIRVKNYAVIDEIEVEFGGGLNVLTGETGAGKSILVDALALALGDRADTGAIRQDADRAEISVTFEVPAQHTANEWLRERELHADDDTCTLRRVLARDGRSRGFINGQPVNLQDMKILGGLLVDIHGQHQHQSLLETANQRELLDAYGGLRPLAASVAEHFEAWQALAAELAARQASNAQRHAEIDALGFQVAELEALAPVEGETERLGIERERLANTDRLLAGVNEALDALAERETFAAYAAVIRARRELEKLAELDPALREPADVLASVEIELREVESTLERYREHIEADPPRLAWLDDRLAKMRSLARRHGCSEHELATTLSTLRSRLESLASGAESITALGKRVAEAARRFLATAESLSTQRTQHAARLTTAVTRELAELGMPYGEFCVGLHPKPADRADATGLERVEFEVKLNPGLPFGALSKVASGGELSRISLGLEVVRAGESPVTAFVFDEVDAGIGGRVADIVGQKLRTISATRQVLCVTHLPQVASHADAHYRVAKQSDGRTTRADVRRLDDAERVEELSRMLGGVEVTARTRAHAAEMIDRAAR